MSEIVVLGENGSSVSDIVDERVCEFLLKDAQFAGFTAVVTVEQLYPGKYKLIMRATDISRSGKRENSDLGD